MAEFKFSFKKLKKHKCFQFNYIVFDYAASQTGFFD